MRTLQQQQPLLMCGSQRACPLQVLVSLQQEPCPPVPAMQLVGMVQQSESARLCPGASDARSGADLPNALLERVLWHVLHDADANWSPHQPLGPSTALLRAAVNLASVCRAWRAAAVQAVQAWPSLDLAPDAWLWPAYLSPLLADLVKERHMVLPCPLLTASEAASFVERASPQRLHAHGPTTASWAVGQSLTHCTCLREVVLTGGLVPSRFPRSLQFLVVAIEGIWGNVGLEYVLQCVAGLHELQELKLLVSFDAISVPELYIPRLPCRHLTLCLTHGLASKLQGVQNLCGLETLAAEDIRIAFDIRLTHPSELSTHRQQLWAALAQGPSLQQLRITNSMRSSAAPASSAELHQLTSVCCRHLVLFNMLGASFSRPLLGSINLEQLLCYSCFQAKTSVLPWSELTVCAGLYVLEVWTGAELIVSGVAAAVPAFDSPWAIIIRQPQQGAVQGLPLSKFRVGPQGHLVWGNRAVSDAGLKAAFVMLNL